ncbi:MAG: rhodanese-like domain-containing protein [Desulfobacteraceae bacterium]|nr:rhodanese-like domain-containing protein [Desulfobacteraceae bacterium]MBC2749071.1 rhodanese-like domain-containing protein [Desulfobacteraceae bacterium]
MNKPHRINWFVVATIALAVVMTTAPSLLAGEPPVSGRLVDGFRILSVVETDTPLQWTVYRGDYIKFELPASGGPFILSVPALGIQQSLTGDETAAPYFKMKQSGRFAVTLGNREGVLQVVDFHPANYREMTAVQAADFIARMDPLILDVRTPGEFKRGHLPHAVLIPVQELQHRIAELSAYRQKDILIYCATGNRSTVASKILIDQGFTRIANMRYGIADWQQRKYPVVR